MNVIHCILMYRCGNGYQNKLINLQVSKRMMNEKEENTEQSIEIFKSRLLELKIKFVEENVIILCDTYIPEYVKFIASLGKQFGYIAKITELNVTDITTCLNLVGDMVDDYEAWNEFSGFKLDLGKDVKFTKAQVFIKQQFYRTRKFLRGNRNIIISSADKGGRVVITDKETYEAKMNLFISKCIQQKIFFKVNLPFKDRRSFVERKFDSLIQNINPYLLEDTNKNYKNLCYQLSAEPFIIAKIYGLFKIHKEGVPIRPIISTTNCMGKRVMTWLLTKLEIITSNVSGFKINDSKMLFERLNGIKMKENHVLSTADFDSMYTNINFGKTKEIIKEYYHLIAKETSVPMDIFLMALSFFIEDDAYFTFKDIIYRQCKGLSMGNALSGILAEIYLSESLHSAIEKVPISALDFLFIYMDDILFGIQEDQRINLINQIMHSSNIKLKSTIEDENNSVSYLNMECIRNSEENSKIEFKWWQKPESACRIIDYHSSHPLHMKINIVNEFVKNVLKITSKKYWIETINTLKTLLSNSNYPNRLIKRIISRICIEIGNIEVTSSIGDVETNAIKMYERMTGFERNKTTNKPENNLQIRSKENIKYLAVPHHPNMVTNIRMLLQKLKIRNVLIAPRIVMKNRSHIWTNTKDKKKLTCSKNATFILKCKQCNFECRVKTNNLDVKRTASHNLKNKFSLPFQHAKENKFHKIIIDLKSIKTFRNKKELNLFK